MLPQLFKNRFSHFSLPHSTSHLLSAHHLVYIWNAGKVTEEKPTSWFIGWKKMWGLSENMKQVLSSVPTCNTVITNKLEARVTSVPSQTYCVTLRSLHVCTLEVTIHVTLPEGTKNYRSLQSLLETWSRVLERIA